MKLGKFSSQLEAWLFINFFRVSSKKKREKGRRNFFILERKKNFRIDRKLPELVCLFNFEAEF